GGWARQFQSGADPLYRGRPRSDPRTRPRHRRRYHRGLSWFSRRTGGNWADVKVLWSFSCPQPADCPQSDHRSLRPGDYPVARIVSDYRTLNVNWSCPTTFDLYRLRRSPRNSWRLAPY